MGTRSDYFDEQIKRTEGARSNYERYSNPETLRKLDEEYGRKQRALENYQRSGAGRGTSKASDYKRKSKR